jgi:hypothetical protein
MTANLAAEIARTVPERQELKPDQLMTMLRAIPNA